MIPTASQSTESADPGLPAPPGNGRAMPRSAAWALGGLTAVGLAYVAVVDPNKPNLVPGCAFKALTGLDCPGCGGTRAVHALLHGDLFNAINHNVLAVTVILAGLLWWGGNRLARRLGREPRRLRFGPTGAVVLVVTISAFWVLRNLPWMPLSWLGSGN